MSTVKDGKKKSFKLKSFVVKIVVVILVGVIIYESYDIYDEMHEREVAVQEYEDIASSAVSVNPEKDPDTGEESVAIDEETGIPELTIDFDALTSQNADFIGWLYWDFDVENDKYDFTLNYPIVKENYTDQYLHVTYTGERNSSGCIFLDEYSDETFMGYSDFLFGHNMRNGSMFGSLDNIYRMPDRDELNSKPLYFYVYTKEATFKYVVYCFESTNNGNDTVYAIINDDEGYDAYVKRLKTLTSYKCPIDVSFDDRPEILSLSTCSGQRGSSKRFVIHGVKIETVANAD
ncbi:MAG: class B sortase [Butyrivibrio sp.]|uniref:class B sortase n=1 Tax=Butyrivibrio sp. TaxID=28121 RepID=UPI0025D9B6E9|nr:class B sortase [Butyrivibrio sp.]MCR5773367.1 class B sortase [Butyrivibrio sp.]